MRIHNRETARAALEAGRALDEIARQATAAYYEACDAAKAARQAGDVTHARTLEQEAKKARQAEREAWDRATALSNKIRRHL
jgi:hypothetical protein